MNRLKYICSTTVRMISLVAAVCILSFILVSASPVDPLTSYVGAESTLSEEAKEQIAEHWGLEDPPVERFVKWADNTIHGDLGNSITYNMPVGTVILDRFKYSIALILSAWVLSGVLGFAGGLAAALKRGSLLDRGIKTFCLILQSAPVFWFGLLMLTVCYAVGQDISYDTAFRYFKYIGNEQDNALYQTEDDRDNEQRLYFVCQSKGRIGQTACAAPWVEKCSFTGSHASVCIL